MPCKFSLFRLFFFFLLLLLLLLFQTFPWCVLSSVRSQIFHLFEFYTGLHHAVYLPFNDIFHHSCYCSSSSSSYSSSSSFFFFFIFFFIFFSFLKASVRNPTIARSVGAKPSATGFSMTNTSCQIVTLTTVTSPSSVTKAFAFALTSTARKLLTPVSRKQRSWNVMKSPVSGAIRRDYTFFKKKKINSVHQINHAIISFLDAPSHLYKRSCLSVRPSVRPSPVIFRRVLGAPCAVYPALFAYLCGKLS